MNGNRKKITSTQSDITAAEIRIRNWFFDFPDKEFSFNEICEQTDTSKTTASIVVQNLIAKGWATKQVIGKLWRLSANMSNMRFKHYKIVHNLELIYGTNVLEYIQTNYPMPRAIVLFGSYRKGDDISTSDIDLAVEIPGTQGIITQEAAIDILGYRKNVKINIHTFSRQTVDINLFNNIANGIVLSGFLEVKP